MFDLADILGMKISTEPWEADNIPYYLIDTYVLSKVALGETLCIFAEPRNVIPPTQSIAKHFSAIYSVINIPIVLKLNSLSGERRKSLIENSIPFVSLSQTFLPFIGVVLKNRMYSEPKSREKLMPSAQLLLLSYLYQSSGKMYTGSMAEKLGISAMQITRAVRQLQKLGFFEVYKEGVQIVVKGKADNRTMFDNAKQYFLDPVREILYIQRDETASRLPYAGVSALSMITMLADSSPPTYAYFSKTEKLHGENGLTDQEKQARIELWKYSPMLLSKQSGVADMLSVIISLENERDDERIDQAIEHVLKDLWG